MTNDNPAAKLYRRLAEWKLTPAGKKTASVRAPDGGWASPHLEALEWTVQVADRLRRLDVAAGIDASASDEFVGNLMLAVFTAEGLFTSSPAHREHISAANLNALRMLALQWPSLPEPDESGLGELAAVAAEVAEMVRGSTTVSHEVREYLLDLITHLERALGEIDKYGTADESRLANELVGALAAYFGGAPDEERGRARDLIARIIRVTAQGVGIAAIAAMEGAASGAAQAMISGA